MSGTQPASHAETVAKVINRVWWLPLVRGIFLVILGGYALFQPFDTMTALAQVIGIFMIADGVITLIAAFSGEAGDRGWAILRGVLELLAGVFAASHPALVAATMASIVLYVVAIIAILSGACEIAAAMKNRNETDRQIWKFVSGIIAILFGILVLMAPLAFGQLFMRVFGILAIIQGIFLIVLALRVRGFGKALGS